MDLEREVVGLIEKTSKMESDIDTLGKQFTAVEKLASSVQELAIAVSGVLKDSEHINKRVECIENEQKDRRQTWWRSIIGFVVGAVGAVIIATITGG